MFFIRHQSYRGTSCLQNKASVNLTRLLIQKYRTAGEPTLGVGRFGRPSNRAQVVHFTAGNEN